MLWRWLHIRWGGPLTAPPLSPSQQRFVDTLRRLDSSPEVVAAAMRGGRWTA